MQEVSFIGSAVRSVRIVVVGADLSVWPRSRSYRTWTALG